MSKKASSKKLKHPPYTGLQAQLKIKRKKQNDIATLLRQSPQTISAKINGTSDFEYHEAVTICHEFNIVLSDFLAQNVS